MFLWQPNEIKYIFPVRSFLVNIYKKNTINITHNFNIIIFFSVIFKYLYWFFSFLFQFQL